MFVPTVDSMIHLLVGHIFLTNLTMLTLLQSELVETCTAHFHENVVLKIDGQHPMIVREKANAQQR